MFVVHLRLEQQSGVYLRHCQASMMELLAIIVNQLKSLSIFTKHSIMQVPQGPRYASDTVCILILILGRHKERNYQRKLKIVQLQSHSNSSNKLPIVINFAAGTWT